MAIEYHNHHKVKEFRIVLPMSVEEYAVGQLWSVAEASKIQTGGGDGVEVCVNEPFDETRHAPPKKLTCNGKNFTRGQYSHKIYHLASKVPGWIRVFLPSKYMQLNEEAWNAYPYTKTVITNPLYMGENFYVIIETYHASDHGDSYNIHGLLGTELNNRHVVSIDVANDPISTKDYTEEYDPCLVGCPKANRPPILKDGTGEWMSKMKPVMCCYKLIKVWFKWFGFQKKVETYLMIQEQRLFLLFHRQLICWQDQYHSLNMDDVRKIEDHVAKDLEQRRREHSLAGQHLED